MTHNAPCKRKNAISKSPFETPTTPALQGEGKRFRLNVLALAFIILFVCLGNWQLSRAHEKKLLLQSYADRRTHQALMAADLASIKDLRFYPAQLHGHFDNAHTLLLDNKIQDGKIGYEVYTPFLADNLATPILVDRGFMPLGISRQVLPDIKAISGDLSITGILNLPPTYFSYGKMTDATSNSWPLRIEYLDMKALGDIFSQALHPYILSLVPVQFVTMPPEKHQAYAFQWFAFALTLLIISVALNRR